MLTAPDMGPLVESLGTEKVEAHVEAEVESRVLLSLKGITPMDVQSLAAGDDNKDHLQECENICKAVKAICAEHSTNFLAHSLQGPCELALGLVSLADISATAASVKDMARLSEDYAADKGLGAGGVPTFFLAHAVGKSLVDAGTSRVESGEQESETMEAFKELDSSMDQLKAVSFGGSVLGVDLIESTLRPHQRLLDTCGHKVAALKQSKGNAEGANPKLKNRVHERFADSLTTHKSAFAECARSLLDAEVKNNMRQHVSFVWH